MVASRAPDGWRYLLLHRVHHGGPALEGDWAWTPPSGSRKPGEDLSACVARELQEEVGWRASPQPVLTEAVGWAVFAVEVPWGTEDVVDGDLRMPGSPADHRRFDFVMRPWSAQEIRERLTVVGFGRVDVGSGAVLMVARGPQARRSGPCSATGRSKGSSDRSPPDE